MVVSALILTNIIGGAGIWFSIVIAECLPVFIYIIYTFRIQKTYKSDIDRLLMIQNSNLITWTYSRGDMGKVDKYLNEESKEILIQIESVLEDDVVLVSNSMRDICNNIFEKVEDVDEIDVTIRLIDDKLYIVFTTGGKLYNPFANESLMNSDNLRELSKLNCKFDYKEILGFSKVYIIFNG